MTAGLLTACDSTPIVLEGNVSYHSGVGVAGATVDATQALAPGIAVVLYADDAETEVAQATTNVIGQYEFRSSAVDDGTYRLRIGNDWHGGSDWATADSIQLQASEASVIDHTLTWAGSVSGTIVDSELDGVEAAVWLVDADGVTVATTLTTAEGSFALGAPTDGTYTVAFKVAGGATVDVGGTTATPITIDAGSTAVDLGQIDVNTGLAPFAPWSATVTVTEATAAGGLKLAVNGTGFTGLPNASTGNPSAGVYVALRDPATMTNDAINADTGIVPAVNYVWGGLITGGNFTTNLTAPTAALEPDADYEVIIWVAHGNITPDTLLSTTPVTLTPEQRAALFG